MLKSSMKVTKYILPPIESTYINPQTYEYTTSRWHLVLHPASLLNFSQCFLAYTHSSHTSVDIFINDIPVTMLFFCITLRFLKFKYPSLKFHIHSYLLEFVARHLCSITFNSTLKVLFWAIRAFRVKIPF